jgi:hypothetical protein
VSPLFPTPPAWSLHDYTTRLMEALKRLKNPPGRPEIDLSWFPELNLESVDRSSVSRRQRFSLPEPKPRGRPTKYSENEIKQIVGLIKALHKNGLTLTLSEDPQRSAFAAAAQLLSRGHRKYTPTAIRNIWQKHKDEPR